MTTTRQAVKIGVLTRLGMFSKKQKNKCIKKQKQATNPIKRTMIVEVELNGGIIGHGVSIGGEPEKNNKNEKGCYLVEKHFARLIEGQDVHNVELMWDHMFKASINYGRKGLVIQSISAVDLALWDCLGKLLKEPVFNLLGGKCKQKLPVYATTVRPDIAQSLGFVGAKIPLPYGPGDGDLGMKANMDRIKECCKSINPKPPFNHQSSPFPLMIDCYMSLTVPYTLELLNLINVQINQNPDFNQFFSLFIFCFANVTMKWVEEYLPPDNYAGYKHIYDYCKSSNQLSSILLTCGEHEYTRYGFKMLLENNCVDVLQPDITWLGGITEAKKVISLASAYDINVIPHGSSVYSYHLQIAFPNCPMAEFLMLSPHADSIQPLFGDLFVDEPVPKDGFIELSDEKFGFGVTLNPKLKLKRPYTHKELSIESLLKNQQDMCPKSQAEWLQLHSKGPAELKSKLIFCEIFTFIFFYQIATNKISTVQNNSNFHNNYFVCCAATFGLLSRFLRIITYSKIFYYKNTDRCLTLSQSKVISTEFHQSIGKSDLEKIKKNEKTKSKRSILFTFFLFFFNFFIF
ncbi:hypothetical protein RFI_13537 [Reticulomyxa filosa]|uniref:Mandelate racemase/muconate lactonizing enzyme C-terminal domain-containing protein n=1 Tax=Reticulomyxa filosa TaxID=46433 RepID=X6NE66_RETFI|nr:hypothetical protein RFI_13537 [Reticulomyxa filosa]|eukprot:ETO23642.1 hypothetical protein RFI_13537 [Reticulomyxa filosa]